MIVKMNLDGVIEKTYGSRVFKGSNSVTEIALFAPFDPQSTVIINFTLPDGTEIPGIMTFADFNVEDHYNMWVYKLRQNVTSMEGRLTLSFEIRAYVDETEVTTTAETHIYVEKSSSTTFLDEVDEFLALANEALVRSQQALNLNQATNEALEIEVERNNEQDNAIATINQTLINQQNAINEHGNELENLKQETNEAIQIEVERNNEQDNAISAINQTLTNQQNVINDHDNKLENLSELPSRMNRAEHNIGVLNNQVNALPEPQDILTKQNYKMPEGYAPTQPKHIADKEYVDNAIEAMSGTNPGHFVTHAQLDEALYKPDFIDLTIDEPVYHITESTLDSPQEIQVIEGNTVEIDGQLVPVKNPVIQSVGKNLFDGAWEVGGYSLDDGTPINASDRIRSLNFTKVKPQQTYSINLEFSNASGAFYFDVNKQFIGYTNNARVFTTPNNCHYVKFVDHITDINKQHMLNLGSTPLPYEPYRSTKLAINGEYHQWDKIVNDGGVYYDEIGSVKVNLWEHNRISQTSTNENTYRFYLNNFNTTYGVEPNTNNSFVVGFPMYRSSSMDERHQYVSENALVLFAEKELIDKQSGTTLEDKLKSYLQENNITGVFQLATPTRKPTSIIKAGDPDFSQGNTIYLHPDTEAIPTVHAKVAMDIAGQVNQLTKDSYEKGKKIHELEVKITDVENSEIPLATVDNDGLMSKDDKQAINDLNTEVSGINQTITDLEDGLNAAFKDVDYTASNGHLTFTKGDGSQKTIDLPLELIVADGYLSEDNQTIVLELANSDVINIPVGALVTDLVNRMPKSLEDGVTLRISGFSNGDSTAMTNQSSRTFNLQSSGIKIAFANITWTHGNELEVIKEDYDEIRLKAVSTGESYLRADVVDVYGNKSYIRIYINVRDL